MADTRLLKDPWLVAVWPGMGNVAAGAGGYLVTKLQAEFIQELPAQEFFDIQHIEVHEGLARTGRLPRSMLFHYNDHDNPHDIIVFLGEAQPSQNGYAFCHRLLDYAQEHGVSRVFTFAAMATQLHPSHAPRVFAVSTENEELLAAKRLGAEVLREGQISGLNGVLLAACAERNLPATCLMGELPFFAAGVPNPRASHVVLKVFSKLAGLKIDFTDIKKQAEAVEEGLLQLLEKMKESAQQQSEEEGFAIPESQDEDGDEDDADADSGEPKRVELDYTTRRRIEQLFEDAFRDRSKAFLLKQELDRLGAFEQYEDRFLDLFKKGE